MAPIDLREHNPDDAIDIRPGTNKAAVIKLLYRDTNLGYTPSEIREALDLPRGATSTTLSRLLDDGVIGKTSDGLYHGFEHRADIRRFARSLVQLDRMVTRYPDPGLGPDDVEQTGTGAKMEISHDTEAEHDTSGSEPAPADWVTGTDTDTNSGAEDDDQ